MIKIIHLITDLDTGGAEMMLYKLITNMDKTEFTNVVVSMMNKGTMGESIEKHNIPLYCLNLKRGILSINSLRTLYKIIKNEKPDIIQTWLYHADFLGLIISKMSKIPLVWNIRCSELRKEDHSTRLFFLIKFLAKNSSYPKSIIANSKAGPLFHEKMGYNMRNWAVIPNGFDLDAFSPSKDAKTKLCAELGISPVTQIIGLVARYDPMKDHSNFLRAASLLHQQKPDVHFVMVGRGVDNQNQVLIQEITLLGLNNIIHLLGERRDINTVYSALDIAVSASYSEGFSNTIGEAMACKVPCVVTDVGESANIVGNTGRVVPPSNPCLMAKAMHDLLNLNKNEREALGFAARSRIIEKFSIGIVCKQYEALYINTLE